MTDGRVYLLHIRDAIDRIIAYTEGGREDFVSHPMVQDAVLRNLAILGEASKRVPDDLRMRDGSIPWREMAGMRDKLIHDYFGVDLTLVWEVVEAQLPPVRTRIDELIAALEA